MAATPDGSVVDEVNSVEEDPVPPRGVGRDDRGEWRTSPTRNRQRSDGNSSSSAGACPCGGYTPEHPSPIDKLVAALRGAGFSTNSRHQRCHGLDPDPDSDDDGKRPKVKIPPPIFKGVSGERPDAHLLATVDWMEAM